VKNAFFQRASFDAAGMMMFYTIRKPLQYGLSVLIAAALLFVGISLFHQQQHPSKLPPIQAPSQAPTQMAINGFHYTANQNGHTGLSIHADRMVVKKKKVGMLRFGMLKEAFFSNARVEINGRNSKKPPAKYGSKQSATQEISIFKDALKFESLASLPMKKVAGIHFTPIDLRLAVDGRRKVWIRANRASITMPSGDIEFKGNVRWSRGRTTIKSETMVASLEKNTLLVPRKYSMNSGGKVTRGNHLRSDLLLSGIVTPHPATTAGTKTNQGYREADITNREKKTYAERR